ncbi:DUF535 family protein [Massilia sp. R2A-15]|uniref:VirK/YbjX family protein n=1 Tax=Massilia sp. R2A-15 TaxID=3064278 RepID=UPI002733D5B6|nr:DUF535 family protein [Massilia sp. R2A-15]WLI91143.1 DUF535 family protein [Massilia sp. R2A-15]
MKLPTSLSLPLFRHRRATLKDQFKLIAGALVYPAQTWRWRAFLASHPSTALLALQYPRVLHKIYRPYLSRHLHCADRVDAMIGHYQHISRFGLETLIARAAARPVTLAAFEGKNGTPMEVRLSAANVGHREGELTLQLFCEESFVYAISFTLSAALGAASIQLGALQGVRSEEGAQLIKLVTKALHGSRPKKWMVALLRDIGDYFGCKTLRMVSNSNRVTINWRRHRRISSDYDALWQELQAEQRGDGDYEVSCAAAPTDVPADVPSHKRAEARRRNELLAAVCGQVRSAFDQRRLSTMRSKLRRARSPAEAPVAPLHEGLRAAA